MSIEVKVATNCDRQNDQQTDRTGHRDVSLPIRGMIKTILRFEIRWFGLNIHKDLLLLLLLLLLLRRKQFQVNIQYVLWMQRFSMSTSLSTSSSYLILVFIVFSFLILALKLCICIKYHTYILTYVHV